MKSLSPTASSDLRARSSLLGLGHALEHHAELDVLDHRAPGKQRVLLEHEGDLARQRRRAPVLPLTSTVPAVGTSSPPIMLSSVLLPQPLGPIRQSSSPRSDVELGVEQRAHMECVARLAELVRDVLDADRDIARGHFGRNNSLISLRMSGSSGSVFIST